MAAVVFVDRPHLLDVAIATAACHGAAMTDCLDSRLYEAAMAGRRIIAFGQLTLAWPLCPGRYIAVQLEQVGAPERYTPTEGYLRYLRAAAQVWDYSEVNAARLRDLGCKDVRVHGIRYSPAFLGAPGASRPPPRPAPEVAVLGTASPRREAFVQRCRALGVRAELFSDTWGAERDAVLRAAGVLANVRYSAAPGILETTRLSVALAAGCVVVSEPSLDEALDRHHAPLVEFAEYDDLPAAAVAAAAAAAAGNGAAVARARRYRKMGSYRPGGAAPVTSAARQRAAGAALRMRGTSRFEPVPSETTAEGHLRLEAPAPPEFPPVSVVTVTKDRPELFRNAVRCFEAFDYPGALEWVVVDDGSRPAAPPAYARHLRVTGPLCIGAKRNLAVAAASHDIVVFLDDDDLYFEGSVQARVRALLAAPCRCVGSTDLLCYDALRRKCSMLRGRAMAEASLAFRRSLWAERPFDEVVTNEGELFLAGREAEARSLPSSFVMMAIRHGKNVTGATREAGDEGSDELFVRAASAEFREELERFVASQ